ncbi:DUF58 domain-containing protein [Niabella hibiscisoli]|uniref:hypothetical protein n=1 Tax=Niabella hibiscisoli TaxID=1825928 RepID=UPI001F0EE664|nr:hypothetical protein [Niabella hibiscisoli]MCH5716780.1 hypothetical protein [Niabella hibiscisoli]
MIATRQLPERLSIGDDNPVSLFISNRYNFPVNTLIIDELPVQLQIRDWERTLTIPALTSETLAYQVKPFTRGEYTFDDINIIVTGPLKLTRRRYAISAKHTVKVYPSFVQMRRFQLLAISNRLQEAGIKK